MAVVREGFGVTVDATQVLRALNTVPQRLAAELKVALKNSAIEHQRKMRTHFVPYRGDNAGPIDLQYRNGSLFKTWRTFPQGETLSNMSLLITAGGTVAYGPTQEFGDPNRVPRQSPYMLIPVEDALDPSGVRKPSMRLERRADGRWYTVSGMPVRRMTDRRGNYIILATAGSTQKAIRSEKRLAKALGERVPKKHLEGRHDLLLYILRKRVSIPARPFFGASLDETRDFRQKEFDGALTRALAGVGGTGA